MWDEHGSDSTGNVVAKIRAAKAAASQTRRNQLISTFRFLIGSFHGTHHSQTPNLNRNNWAPSPLK